MSWYDGTGLAGLEHRQQHGFDTWDDEQWQEVYGFQPPNDVHARDHAIDYGKADLGHVHDRFCPRGQQVEAPHDHAACVFRWLETTV
jgi:hypothetical protein